MHLAQRLFRHLWLDRIDSLHAVGPAGLDRLERLIGASERTHTGQICLCIEAGLPLGTLWRHVVRGVAVDALVRERAVDLFGSMRVWDTEYNNGVLIYLQLAEHRIEIVADRGLARRVDTGQWQAVVAGSCEDFRKGEYEAGLGRAIDAVTRALAIHFPPGEGRDAGVAEPANELPDRPVTR